jgi:2-polyprenyl-3-methyl-5-hydroxy-6-metoxy-1,4-benzoquinol methylase
MEGGATQTAAPARRTETWDSFWAQKLRLDFFDGQWDMYHKAAKSRADWLTNQFSLETSRPVLSCACGEAGIELALAQQGIQVTGIDKCATFIHYAREEAGASGLPATFLTADLRASQPGGDRPLPGGNGCVMCFDTLGLLSMDDELALLKRMVAALGPGGVLLVDAPKREEQASGRVWWPLKGGYLLQETRWEKASSTLLVEPLYIEPDGTIVDLQDPYDQTRGAHSGILRHVYAPEELAGLVTQAGIYADIVNHQRKGYVMVAARKE